MRKKPSLENHQELKGLVEELQRMESGEELLAKTVEAGERAESQRPQPEIPRKNIILIATLAVVIIAVLGTAIWLFIVNARKANTIAVPEVLKLEIRAAQTVITSNQLRVRVSFDSRSKAKPGTVLHQQPAAGTQLHPGDEVTLTVAAGEKPQTSAPIEKVTPANEITMPEVIGLVDTEARQRLEKLGMKVEIIAIRDTSRREYMVVASNPAANSKLAPGSTVKLTVNLFSTSAEANIRILDYAGKSAEETIAELTHLGFVVTSKKVPSRNFASGKVTGTEPPGNSSLAPGSSVMVLIAL